jgi:prolyl 4-hydroxylase
MTTPLDTLDEEGILVVDELVTASACVAMLKELQFAHWGESSVVKYIGDERSPAYLSKMRQSQTSGQFWFTEDLNEALALIEAKLADLLRTSPKHFEEWQASRYGVDDKFDFHVDGGNWELSSAGERKRSILIYLDTPLKGGATRFRALNKTIAARAGRGVVWNNLLPTGKCNFAMIHAGLPVDQGTKTILVTWERERQLRP